MSYAARADMEARYRDADLVELTDVDEPYTGAIVDAVLDQALADAAEIIDGYLRPRYRLPLSVTPTALTRVACTLAYFYLHRNGAPEEIERAYKDALRTLEQIRKGDIDLGLAGEKPVEAPSGAPRFAGAPRTFTADSLKDY